MDDCKGNELLIGHKVIGLCQHGFLIEGELIDYHRFNNDRTLRMEPVFVIKFEPDPEVDINDYECTDDYLIEGTDKIMVHPIQGDNNV